MYGTDGHYFSYSNHLTRCDLQLYCIPILPERVQSVPDFQWRRNSGNIYIDSRSGLCEYKHRSDQSERQYGRHVYSNQYDSRLGWMLSCIGYFFHYHHHFTHCNDQLCRHPLLYQFIHRSGGDPEWNRRLYRRDI